ncbi:MAG TPA: ATP-binding protein [Cellvibrio sp.]|nr:ATP-binding protein [Cellvibrio sp.]
MLSLRTLTLTLLLTIITGSVGAGLLLDKLYAGLHSSEKSNKGLTEAQLEVIGAQLSNVLRTLENKNEFIQAWQTENVFLSLELVNRDDIRMPEELIQTLERTGHLTLSSAASVSYYFPAQAHNYYVLRAPLANQNKSGNWLPILFTIFFYALLILTVFIWLLPLIRRLQTLQLSAKKLGEGDLSARITPGAISHINDIELEFNRMAQRIEELVSDISLLSSAISHEMRAPLAKLQFGLDALREEDDQQKRQVYEDRLDKVIADMTNLIETLLRYARLDKNIAQLPQSEVDLRSLCNRLIASGVKNNVDPYDSSLSSPAITINAREDFYLINGDVFYLNLLMENLLSNAIKYGKGEVMISLQREKDYILFTIEDNGPGIAEEFKQDIFKPFMRGEHSGNGSETQTASQKGHGLGMALVKRIADLHKVKIDITTSEVLGGAKFILLFAVSNP